MINETDIEAMKPDDFDALETGLKFCERRRRGIPPDRWATTEELNRVAIALEMAICGWAGEARARYEGQLSSMRMVGET